MHDHNYLGLNIQRKKSFKKKRLKKIALDTGENTDDDEENESAGQVQATCDAPRRTNFNKFKLHTDRSVVNELKTEIWNTKEVTDLQYPDHLSSITSRFVGKHDPGDISESEACSFASSSLSSQCHKSKPASEDTRIKLDLLKERSVTEDELFPPNPVSFVQRCFGSDVKEYYQLITDTKSYYDRLPQMPVTVSDTLFSKQVMKLTQRWNF